MIHHPEIDRPIGHPRIPTQDIQETHVPTIRRPMNRNAPVTGSDADTIDNLVLQHRAYFGLRCAFENAGVTDTAEMTITAAKDMSDHEIMRTPNTGRKSVRDIRAEIERYLGDADVDDGKVW